jgi:hypothetical protein
MKDKLLAQLKIKFVGVSNLILDRVAESLAKTVTDEAKIPEALTALDSLPISISDYAGLLQSEGDRRITELQKTHSKVVDDLKKQIPVVKTTPEPTDEMPAWAKAMADQNKQLMDKLAANEAASQRSNLLSKLFASPALKDIPDTFRSKYTIEKEEDIPAVESKIVSEFAALTQDMVNKGVVTVKPANSKAADDKAASPAVKAYAAEIAKPTENATVGKPLVSKP